MEKRKKRVRKWQSCNGTTEVEGRRKWQSCEEEVLEDNNGKEKEKVYENGENAKKKRITMEKKKKKSTDGWGEIHVLPHGA